jgi:hypothetical protein
VDEPERHLLEETLQCTTTPDAETVSSLAVLLEKRRRQVQVWFQNKRQRSHAQQEERVPVTTAVVACAYARAFANGGSDAAGIDRAVRFASATVATAPDLAALAHDAMWASILSDAAKIREPHISRDDAVTIAATAFLVRVAECCRSDL